MLLASFMNSPRLFLLGCLGGLLLWASGCSHTQPALKSLGPSPLISMGEVSSRSNLPSRRLPQDREDAEVERRAQALANFSAGLMAQERDSSDDALRYFNRSLAEDPSNESLAIDLARRYWSLLQTNRAIEVMRQTTTRAGSSSESRAFLGTLYLQAHRYPEATTAFRSAVDADPENLPAYQALVPLLSKEKRWDEARKLLDRAFEQKSSEASFWVDLSSLYGLLEKGNARTQSVARQKGLKCAQRAEQLKPADPVLLQRMGDRFLALGESQHAETIFRDLRSRYPNSPAPTAKLAEIYLREGKIKEAKEQLEALRRNNPADPIPYYYLGLVAMDEREFSKATAHFDRAIFLNPEWESAYLELAAAQLSQKLEAAALTALDQARTRFGSSYRGEFLSAMAYARKKDWAQSDAHFQAAEKAAQSRRQLESLDHRFYYQWGSMLETAGRHEESERMIRRSLAIKPDFDEALNHLAYTWVEQGIHLTEARKMIDQALKADPENPAYLDSMAWVLFKLGKPMEALPFIERASKGMPEPDATVEDHLGDILNAVGRTAEARDAWKRSLSVEQSESVQKKLE